MTLGYNVTATQEHTEMSVPHTNQANTSMSLEGSGSRQHEACSSCWCMSWNDPGRDWAEMRAPFNEANMPKRALTPIHETSNMKHSQRDPSDRNQKICFCTEAAQGKENSRQVCWIWDTLIPTFSMLLPVIEISSFSPVRSTLQPSCKMIHSLCFGLSDTHLEALWRLHAWFWCNFWIAEDFFST